MKNPTYPDDSLNMEEIAFKVFSNSKKETTANHITSPQKDGLPSEVFKLFLAKLGVGFLQCT